jgi:hypothetical protein
VSTCQQLTAFATKESKHMCFNVFLNGKTLVSYIFHIKKTQCFTLCLQLYLCADCFPDIIKEKIKNLRVKTKNNTLQNKTVIYSEKKYYNKFLTFLTFDLSDLLLKILNLVWDLPKIYQIKLKDLLTLLTLN